MKPIVRWPGGKTKLLPELLARIPSQYGRYYEPFLGGGAMFFALAPERAVLGDANADLMAMYRVLADRPESIIRVIDQHAGHHGPMRYYHTRDLWNDATVTWTPLERAAAFIYLNKTCFNGLWRMNRAGDFNVPMGRTSSGRPPLILDADGLRAAAKLFSRAELRTGHFRDTVRDAQAGDFVYFDPPYVPVSRTANFTAYAPGGFGPEDQRDLAELVRDLTARGVHVLASNSDTPLVRELYAGMRIDVVQCPRAINSKGSARGKVNEVIVVGEPVARARAA